jgi:hypothetical protein
MRPERGALFKDLSANGNLTSVSQSEGALENSILPGQKRRARAPGVRRSESGREWGASARGRL